MSIVQGDYTAFLTLKSSASLRLITVDCPPLEKMAEVAALGAILGGVTNAGAKLVNSRSTFVVRHESSHRDQIATLDKSIKEWGKIPREETNTDDEKEFETRRGRFAPIMNYIPIFMLFAEHARKQENTRTIWRNTGRCRDGATRLESHSNATRYDPQKGKVEEL